MNLDPYTSYQTQKLTKWILYLNEKAGTITFLKEHIVKIPSRPWVRQRVLRYKSQSIMYERKNW